MKQFFTLSIILFSLLAQAQSRKTQLSLDYSIGNGSLTTFVKMDGGGRHDGKSLKDIGLNYSYSLRNSNWHLGLGLHYTNYKYTVSSSYPFPSERKWNYVQNLLSFPVKFRYDVGKYIFFNGNLYLDIDISKRSSRELSGIGAGLGMGGQYYFNDKVGIYINPQLDFRNLASILGSPYKLLGTGVAIGVAYRIK